jgi:hypothetical protein
MVGRGFGLRALPVAAEVGHRDREVLRKAGSNTAPHRVRLRMAMQEEERRAASTVAHANRRLAGVDELELETFEQGRA